MKGVREKEKNKDCEARKKMQEEVRKESQKKRQTALRKKESDVFCNTQTHDKKNA